MKHFLTTVLCLLGACAAAAPQPRHGEKLLVINDDGFSSFYSGRYKTAEDLRKQMLLFQDTQVAVMEWCITSGSRVNFPAKTSELVGTGVKEFGRRGDQLAAETLRRLADEGVDTLQVVAQGCREAGMLCYASMRMNGDYGTVPPENSTMFNSEFWHAHPEFRMRGAKGEPRITLSYAFPEVRAFKLGILREAAAREIDGVQLDFLRHPPFFGYEAPLVEAFQAKYGEDPRTLAADDPRWVQMRAGVMTDFLREIRKMLDAAGEKKGRHLGLAARVDWREYRALGCDLEAWLREGLLDYLALAQHSLGGYEFDLAPFVKLARGTGCAVLFGEEGITTGHDTTAAEDKLIAAGKMTEPPRGQLSLAEHQARAARWYAAGADGVHLFNVGNLAVLKSLGSVPAGAELFRATISPVTEAQHGQWNVALAELAPGRVLAIWEAGHTEVKTANVIMAAESGAGGRSWSERREFVQREGMRCTPCGFYRAKGRLHCVHAELPLAGFDPAWLDGPAK